MGLLPPQACSLPGSAQHQGHSLALQMQSNIKKLQQTVSSIPRDSANRRHGSLLAANEQHPVLPPGRAAQDAGSLHRMLCPLPAPRNEMREGGKARGHAPFQSHTYWADENAVIADLLQHENACAGSAEAWPTSSLAELQKSLGQTIALTIKELRRQLVTAG